MVQSALSVIGAKRGSAYECRLHADSRYLNLSQFELLLRLCLYGFENPNEWVSIDVLLPEQKEGGNGRKYIERIRAQLASRELVANRRPKLYRLALSPREVHFDDQVWSLTDVDPVLLQRLRAAYIRYAV